MFKTEIRLDNFSELRTEASRKREDVSRQEEVLSDTLSLRDFALEHDLDDAVVELGFEMALIHQHSYMESRDKAELQKMKAEIDGVNEYVRSKGLSKWESRVARYLGRVADYEEKYKEAMTFYQEAIDKVDLDPKYESNKAMAFEYFGFLVVDELRVGNINLAIEKAEKLYLDYENTEEAKELKKKDYTTWAIWRSAVLINLASGLISLSKYSEYKENIDGWLVLAERNFDVPEGVTVWSDFGFRKNEISKIRDSIRKIVKDE